jgi:uncharacterized protein (TIGR02453 family)
MPTHFTPDFLNFFIELAPNNNKDWFDINRDRYKKSVKEPFEAFVEKLIIELRKTEDLPKDLKASDCIFRINKDIRFSKDKSPYKLQATASISKGGKKDFVNPGLYIELGPEHLGIYTGVYLPDKDVINKVRHHIAAHLPQFESIINDKKFKATYGEVQGEKAKLLPPELKTIAVSQPLIFNKQFYLVHHSEPDMIVEKDVLKYIIDTYKVAKNFNQFIYQVI